MQSLTETTQNEFTFAFEFVKIEEMKESIQFQ
jgi:hypothetical protein